MGIVAPDNAAIADIKAKTDALPADPASDTTILTRASQGSVDALPTSASLAGVFDKIMSIPSSTLESDERAQLMSILNGMTPAQEAKLDAIPTATLTPEQDATLTTAAQQATIARKHATNKAEKSADGLGVTISDDDGETPLTEFTISADGNVRTPV